MNEANGNLVLSRKEGESLRIGSAVVMVSKIRGGQVKLTIQAPREVQVTRCELEPRKEAA